MSGDFVHLSNVKNNDGTIAHVDTNGNTEWKDVSFHVVAQLNTLSR